MDFTNFKKIILCTILLFQMTSCAVQKNPNTNDNGDSLNAQICWDDLSTSDDWLNTGDNYPDSMSIASSKNGDIWIAWYENKGSKSLIHVLSWDGAEWSKHPDVLGGTTGANDPRIAVLENGNPILTWRASGKMQSHIFAATLKDGNWKQLGEPLSGMNGSMTHAGAQKILITQNGYPIVVWNERHQDGKYKSLFASMWDGQSWNLMGKNIIADSPFYSLQPYIHQSDNGDIFVSWNGGTKESPDLGFAKWDGQNWVPVISTRNIKNEIWKSVTASDNENNPILIWLERNQGRFSKPYISVFIDGMEKEIPPPSFFNSPNVFSAYYDAIRIENGFLLLTAARDERKLTNIQAFKYDGSSWTTLLKDFHLEGGNTTVQNMSASRYMKNNFLMSWVEDDVEGRSRIRIIKTRECKSGERPKQPPEAVSEEDFWPKTVDEAASKILSSMDDESKKRVKETAEKDLIMYHHGWGTGIRNAYGLWRGNKELLISCGAADIHPDDCSQIIIENVWKKLQE